MGSINGLLAKEFSLKLIKRDFTQRGELCASNAHTLSSSTHRHAMLLDGYLKTRLHSDNKYAKC